MSYQANPYPPKDYDLQPPYSRVFVVCSKDAHEDDLRRPFEEHGEIEDIYMPKNHDSGQHKGIAYIKYTKTSSAAAAILNLHQTRVGPTNKPIKVMLASNNKHDKINHHDTDKFKRLFIKVSKTATEADIKEDFSQFGEVEYIRVQRDRDSSESKGLAYVHFTTFLDAAKAFEQCDKKYKPVFAKPKQDLKRTRDSYGSPYEENFQPNNSFGYNDGNYNNYGGNNYNQSGMMQGGMMQGGMMQSGMMQGGMMQSGMMQGPAMPMDGINSLINTTNQGFTCIDVVCSSIILQKHIESLFNVIPGLLRCQYSVDMTKNNCRAVITYEDGKAAAHAVQRLNNFEFPSGEILTVTSHNQLSKAASELATIVNGFKQAADTGSSDLVQLADAIAQASMLIKAATAGKAESSVSQNAGRQMYNFCNVPLPPVQPLATDGRVAQRCFIVCKPQPPPDYMLRDLFCRFGNLINISTFPNKTFGFAKYATINSATDAIETLNKATAFGIAFKVLKADDKPSRDGKNGDMDVDTQDSKRMRLDNDDSL